MDTARDCAPGCDLDLQKGGTVTQEGPFEGARALLRGCRYGTLATLAEGGAPFASLVALASDERGAPLLLLSDLARHTQNLKRDGSASLLLDGSEGRWERLAAARLLWSPCVWRRQLSPRQVRSPARVGRSQ